MKSKKAIEVYKIIKKLKKVYIFKKAAEDIANFYHNKNDITNSTYSPRFGTTKKYNLEKEIEYILEGWYNKNQSYMEDSIKQAMDNWASFLKENHTLFESI